MTRASAVAGVAVPPIFPDVSLRYSLIFLCAGLAACGRGSSGSTDSSYSRNPSAPGGAASSAASSSSAKHTSSPCPGTGRWALCNLEKRLYQAGFVVRRVNGVSPRTAGFAVAPAVYTVGRARLEVFIYPDEAALAKDIAGIDTLTASPRGTPGSWEATPTLVQSGNLAAVFLTDSPIQAERLTLAITAGAPQPNSSR